MTLWNLKNPHELPMVITLQADGTAIAEFPAIQGCRAVSAVNDDPWKARDEAIAKCAQMIVDKFHLEYGGRDVK